MRNNLILSLNSNQNKSYFFSIVAVSDVQVQVDSNIQDLQAWLEMLQNNFSTMTTRDRQLVAAIWEGVWSQRNQAWLQKPTLSPFQLLLQSAANLRSFKRAQTRESHHRSIKQPPQERWEALPPGIFKVNTNGATFEEDNAYGVRDQ